jgi:hypothetical protein
MDDFVTASLLCSSLWSLKFIVDRLKTILCKKLSTFKKMKNMNEIETLGINAVKKLRKSRLSRGDFFMINSNSLPPDQCYLEYPGGAIKLAMFESGAKNFTIVHELEIEESSNLRKKFNLELIH